MAVFQLLSPASYHDPRGDDGSAGVSVWPWGALLATPGARAQQRPPLIGLLSSTSAEPYKPLVDAFTSGLRERGFVEGRNLAIEHRWVDGNYERLAGLAKDLVALRANVIVAVAPPAARAAKAATASIPNVVSKPVAIRSLSALCPASTGPART